MILHGDFLGATSFVKLWLLKILSVWPHKIEPSFRVGIAAIPPYTALVRFEINLSQVATICLTRAAHSLVLWSWCEATHSQFIWSHELNALLHRDLAWLVMSR